MTPTELWTALGTVVAPPACALCRAGLPPGQPAGWRAALCPECARGVTPAPAELAWGGAPGASVAAVTALFRYRGAGRALLRRLKYDGRDDLADPLGRALGRRFRLQRPEAATDRDLLLVPVPLHRWRQWRRGFNQAELIARGAAASLERSTALALARSRRTRPLYGVPRAGRAAAVAGAFRVRDPALVRDRPVALVDDIRTTGATLEAAASALRAAGCRRVDALVVAC